MIIKTNNQRIYVVNDKLEAVYPEDSLGRFADGGYCVQVAGREFNVNNEIGEALLNKLEERETAERRVLDRIKTLIQPHAREPDGKCIIEPRRDPAEWLREIERDLSADKKD